MLCDGRVVGYVQITDVDNFHVYGTFERGPHFAHCAELLGRQAALKRSLEAIGDDDALEDSIHDQLDELGALIEARFSFSLDGSDGPQPLGEFRLESEDSCYLRFE